MLALHKCYLSNSLVFPQQAHFPQRLVILFVCLFWQQFKNEIIKKTLSLYEPNRKPKENCLFGNLEMQHPQIE